MGKSEVPCILQKLLVKLLFDDECGHVKRCLLTAGLGYSAL
jgi:hypothetical protein